MLRTLQFFIFKHDLYERSAHQIACTHTQTQIIQWLRIARTSGSGAFTHVCMWRVAWDLS